MRKLFTLLLIGSMLPLGLMAQNQGGPDAYGYVWRNDQAPNGPTYNWIDITTTGTQITGLADDNFVGPLNLGFSFHYYWTDVTKVFVGSNGYITFEAGGQISSNNQQDFPGIPNTAAPNNVVAPMLTDLNFTQDAGAPANPAKAYFFTKMEQ